jgi:hypothetical protein
MFFKPALSVIAVFHNMAREAPRTLFTLSAQYQRGFYPDDYEVIVVDAGSSAPLEQRLCQELRRKFPPRAFRGGPVAGGGKRN